MTQTYRRWLQMISTRSCYALLIHMRNNGVTTRWKSIVNVTKIVTKFFVQVKFLVTSKVYTVDGIKNENFSKQYHETVWFVLSQISQKVHFWGHAPRHDELRLVRPCPVNTWNKNRGLMDLVSKCPNVGRRKYPEITNKRFVTTSIHPLINWRISAISLCYFLYVLVTIYFIGLSLILFWIMCQLS